MTTATRIDLGNPLGYRCPPNGAGADVIAETDLNRFLAYGFVASYAYAAADPKTAVEYDGVYWLRQNFLDAVRLAVEHYGDLKPGERYTGEQPDNTVELGGDRLGWCFEARATDCLIITLEDGYDGKSVFLHLDAIADSGHVEQALHAAAVINEQLLHQEA